MSADSSRSPFVVAGDHAVYIEGTAVNVTPKDLPLEDVVLDPDNPRIQHAAKQKRGQAANLTQQQLRDLILEQPGVSDLFKTVRDNGGLIERIYVRPDGRVIEGNCRAASYMRLHEAKPTDARWKAIPVFVVPSITDRQVAILQGHFHVSGKNKWRAYEKAGHVHYMHSALKMTTKDIAQSLGLQVRVVERLLQAYKTMAEKVLPKVKGGGLAKWSHVEEFYKNKDLEEHRQDKAHVDEFVGLVVSGKIKKGADVRKLPKILSSPQAKKALETKGVDAAVAVLGKQDPTADSAVFRKLKEVTELLQEMGSSDLTRLREERKPKQIVKDLAKALKNLANAANMEL